MFEESSNSSFLNWNICDLSTPRQFQQNIAFQTQQHEYCASSFPWNSKIFARIAHCGHHKSSTETVNVAKCFDQNHSYLDSSRSLETNVVLVKTSRLTIQQLNKFTKSIAKSFLLSACGHIWPTPTGTGHRRDIYSLRHAAGLVPGGGLAGRSRMSRWIILELCVVDVCDF